MADSKSKAPAAETPKPKRRPTGEDVLDAIVKAHRAHAALIAKQHSELAGHLAPLATAYLDAVKGLEAVAAEVLEDFATRENKDNG